MFQKFYMKRVVSAGQRLSIRAWEWRCRGEHTIFKLQQACEFEYAAKLQQMFQDIGLS